MCQLLVQQFFSLFAQLKTTKSHENYVFLYPFSNMAISPQNNEKNVFYTGKMYGLTGMYICRGTNLIYRTYSCRGTTLISRMYIRRGTNLIYRMYVCRGTNLISRIYITGASISSIECTFVGASISSLEYTLLGHQSRL